MFSIKELLTAAVLLMVLMVSSASAQFIYVANAGDDTISKIDVTTNQVVATYSTWFTSGPHHIVHPAIGTFGDRAHQGPAPSRIAIDASGYVYVLDRFFSTANTSTGSINPPHFPVLLKIAPTGGIPGTTTSNGSNPLPIVDANNSNDIDIPNTPIEAQDVRILWAKPIGSGADVTGLGRALAIDTTGYLWVGLYSTKVYYKVDPSTGTVVGLGVSTGVHTPYTAQVDKNGKLWSVDETNTLAEIDTLTGQFVTVLDHSNFGPNHTNYGQNYSLAIYNGCGSTPVKVYLSERTLGRTYIVYDPQTQTLANSPSSIPQFASVAIGVDSQGNIISGAQAGGRIIKTTPGGAVLWDNGPVVPAAQQITDLHGIIMDPYDNVYAVDRYGDRVLKYSGANGAYLGAVMVGDQPYTYGNTPPPTCPCVQIGEHPITCQGLVNGVATYAWSFLFTNHSPFGTPATGIDLTSSQVTNISPAHVQFTNPVLSNGQATVSGTFTVSNPVPGSHVCLDVQLSGGEGGWCCPREQVCFVLPDCPHCANLQASFTCQHGQHVLQLSVTNQQSTAAQSVTVFSNTAGVTVSPQTLTQTFPANTAVTIPLTVTGASPGQTISLSVNLSGPVDPKTGVNTWCCTSTVTVIYPKKLCPITIGGFIFNDRGGDSDYDENGLSGWTVTIADEKGARRTTISDASGRYNFENIEQGTYRVSVQAGAGWRATKPATGFYTVTAPGPPVQKLDFGFAKMQP